MSSNPTAIFRALSDETRLIIVALLLAHGELCGCELEAVLDITQSKTSRHLRYLLNAGLLRDRRMGVSIYYRIAENLPSSAFSILRDASTLINQVELAELSRRIREFRAMRCAINGRFAKR